MRRHRDSPAAAGAPAGHARRIGVEHAPQLFRGLEVGRRARRAAVATRPGGAHPAHVLFEVTAHRRARRWARTARQRQFDHVGVQGNLPELERDSHPVVAVHHPVLVAGLEQVDRRQDGHAVDRVPNAPIAAFPVGAAKLGNGPEIARTLGTLHCGAADLVQRHLEEPKVVPLCVHGFRMDLPQHRQRLPGSLSESSRAGARTLVALTLVSNPFLSSRCRAAGRRK